MRARKLILALFSILILFLSISFPVSAHQTVTVGPYNIEIGWLSEPPIIGQMNAIVMNLSTSDGSETPVTESTSNLTLTVSYGGQTKTLTLEPLGEDTPGQYIAPILATVPGLYTVDVNGTLGSTAIQAQVQPEEVQAADSVQFPQVNADPAKSSVTWTEGLGIAALVISLGALVLAILALRKHA